jgi:ABC-2 type transport system ATP-binding protein
MKMITGYLSPDNGVAMVSNINVVDNPIAAKRKIGYLPEANPLYFDMYVKEYLHFIAGVHEVKEKRRRIDEVITLTGLQVEQKKKISELSKGYKQRVGLAAALIHEPEVLILDEPTSGLDPNQIIEIRNVIKQQGQNKTVLFSSHICDRVIIINKGQLVADDTLANLQQQGTTNFVKVTFKEVLEAAWMNQLHGTTSIKKLDNNSWRIEANDPNGIKKQLLELSLLHNLNIVSLQTEGGSLEEIFRNLTMVK